MSKTADFKALEKIENEYGKGTILKMDDDYVADIEAIPTGIKEIDDILGVGGFPVGRITNLYGPEGSGKSSLALHAVKEAVDLGKRVVFIDAEFALNTEYARNIGIDLSKVYIYQPETAEQAFDIIYMLLEDVDYIVIDSMPALVPEKELAGGAADQNVALQARLFSKELRKLSGQVSKQKTAVVCINQLREKVNNSGWGKSWKATGGRALKFYSSINLEVRNIGQIKKGTGQNSEKIGHKMRIKANKNKLAAPFKEVVVDLLYGKGIDFTRTLLKRAIKKGLIKKKTSWYYYGEETLGQGQDVALEFVSKNKDKIKKELDN